MNWNNNDTKYILKRVIVYFVIACILFFAGQRCAKALTLEGWNTTNVVNGNNYTYNALPQSFKYNGVWYNTSTYNDFIYEGGAGTNNINYYFNNPCGSGESMSYTQNIQFSNIGTQNLNFNSVRVINDVQGCVGSWSKNASGVNVYNLFCALQDGPPRVSLYFDWTRATSDQSDWVGLDVQYRVGLEDFSVTCNLNSGSIIEANNENTDRIIDNQNQNTQETIDAINSVTDIINDDYDSQTGTDYLNVFNNLFTQQDENVIRQFVMIPFNLYILLYNSITNGSCQSISLGALYGVNLSLPCIDLRSILGVALYTAIDTIMGACLLFGIVRMIKKFFNSLFSLSSKATDECGIEVFK